MTSLDRLAQQIENILHQQKTLKSENQKLKERIELLSTSEEMIAKLQEEQRQQKREIEELTQRLERLLTL